MEPTETTTNPWRTIWSDPKDTILSIVAKNPDRGLWWLAAIYGFSSLLNSFQSFFLGHQIGLFQIYFLALLISPIWGYIGFSVWSFFVLITGKVFGGMGTFKTVRASYAWSCVPLAVNASLWIVMGLVFGRELFMASPDTQPLTQSQVAILFGVLVIRFVTMIWSLVIYVIALSAVQNYHPLKAIGNLLVSGLCLGVVLYLIVLLSVKGFGGPGAIVIPIKTMFNLG